MSFDTYVIDENAARSDMMKIGQARQKLQQARNTLKHLNEEAEGMQGQTGAAIAEKSQELMMRIDQLSRRLQASVELLNQTVSHYQSIDAWHADWFRK